MKSRGDKEVEIRSHYISRRARIDGLSIKEIDGREGYRLTVSDLTDPSIP